MNRLKKAKLWWLLACVLVLAWFVWGVKVAQASGNCKGNSCNDAGDVDVNVGGDTINVGGDTINTGDVSVPVDITGGDVSMQHKSESLGIGLSNSLGDVDIAGCLGSTQWATPLYSRQKLVVNWPCLAEFYLRNSQYELAAMAICNTEVIKEFESEEACEAAHDFAPAAAAPPPPVSDEQIRQMEMYNDQLAMVQMEIEQIEERIERSESRPAPPPRTIVQQQPPAFTEEQKAAAWAALTGEGDNEDE